MSKKKKTKTVTAPKTYDPGLGRPKEHLAYLNWQEMEALKRLNKEGPKRGPVGLPSFASTKSASSGWGGMATAGNTPGTSPKTTSSSGSKSVTSMGSMSQNTSSKAPAGSNTMSRAPSSYSGSYAGSGRPSGSPATASISRATASTASRNVGGTGRPTGVGSTTSRIGSAASSQRVGSAYSGVGGTGRSTTTPGGAPRSLSGVGSPSDRATISRAESNNTKSARQSPSYREDAGKGSLADRTSGTNTGLGGQIRGTISGIQGPGGYGSQPVRVGVPRATITTNPMASQGTSYATPAAAKYGNMVVTGNILTGFPASGSMPTPAELGAQTEARARTGRLVQQYSQYRSPPVGYPAAPQGVFGPRAGAGTSAGYLRTVNQPGIITKGLPTEAERALQTYEAEKRSTVVEKLGGSIPKMQDRVTEVSQTLRRPVPGLITDPTLGRFSTGQPIPGTLSSGVPVVTDPRVGIKPGSYPAAPPNYPRISEDPTMEGRTVVPSWQQGTYKKPVGGMSFTPDISGPTYPRLSEDPTMGGRIVTPSWKQGDYTGKAVKAGESYVNPSGVPDSVKKALADAGYNPDGSKMTPEQKQAYEKSQMGTLKYRYPIGPALLSDEGNIPWSRPISKPNLQDLTLERNPFDRDRLGPPQPGIGNQYDFTYDPTGAVKKISYGTPKDEKLSAVFDDPGYSLGDIGEGIYNVGSEALQGIGGLFSAGMNYLSDIGTPPGAVVSGPNGLEVKNPDGSYSPYPVSVKPIQDRIPQTYGPLSPDGQYMDKGPVYQAPQGLPPATGETSISGVRAIPAPDSIGILPGGGGEPAPQKQVTVRSGDSLSKIARENGVSVGSLLNANPQISDPNRIQRGERINIPSVGYQGEGDGEAGSYENENTADSDFVDTTDGSVSPSQEPASPSQDATVTEEAQVAKESFRKKTNIARKIGVPVVNLVLPGLGTLFGQALKYANESTQKLVGAYESASIPERKEMEEAFPNLIAHGNAMGIQTYYGMDKYDSWAAERGLRGQADFSRGAVGIESLMPEYYGSVGSYGGQPSDSDGSGGGSSGGRPEIYYMWDLGVNIPSPGDSNYTQYQTYLADRLASQRALGWA